MKMKTSLRELLHHNHKHDRTDRKIQPLAQLDELAKASEAMRDMRECYDSLLSAAATATNSAYEFSESLREMGVCLLQNIALNDDDETGKVMLMLGKLQFELQQLIDEYRSHIFQTITVPSESLINELHTIEDMKHQCDEKRELYEYMKARSRGKERLNSGNGESFSMQQLQVAKDEFDEEATLFVFRLKSLKQGLSRSLLTQAARHHAAQLSFFRKALKSLEAVEPHVQLATQQQHIDYQFIGLEDDESENGEHGYHNDEDVTSISVEDNKELRVDYQPNQKLNFVSIARNIMEVNVRDSYGNSLIREQKMLSQSAPLFSQRKFDPTERIRQLRPSSTRKFHSYVLPKPGDATSTISFGSENLVSQTKSSPLHNHNLYHSNPLEPSKNEKFVGIGSLSGPIILNSKSILKESNNNRMPPPLTERISSQKLNPQTTSRNKKLKSQSLSGPLASMPLSSKPSLLAGNPIISTEASKFASGPTMRSAMRRSSSSKVSSSASTTSNSLRINELHELPRPPAHLIYNSGRPPNVIGFSAPFILRSPENSTSKSLVPKAASELPTLSGASSFKPLSGPGKATRSAPSRPLDTFRSSEKLEDIASPSLRPILLANLHPT